MKFKTVHESGGKKLVKIEGLAPDDAKGDKDGTWANCPENVYKWAQSKYKEGDEVDVEYAVKNGEYTVTRITQQGGGSTNTTGKGGAKKSYYSKSPQEQESIKRQAILKASCQAVVVLQGHINTAEQLAEAVKKVFDALYKKVTE